jgi:hypothetical protein
VLFEQFTDALLVHNDYATGGFEAKSACRKFSVTKI